MRRTVLVMSLLSLAACSSGHHAKTGDSCGSAITSGIVSGHLLSSASPIGSSTVFIYIESANGEDYACSGTLIDRQLVLTAQHCVDNGSKIAAVFSDSVAAAGSSFNDPVILADSWAKYGESYATPHDLAVIHLSEPAPANYLAQRLPSANYDVYSASGLTAAGFGVTSECQADDGTLRAADFPINDLVTSFDFNKDGITVPYSEPGMLLVDQSEAGICHGDSGGPLYAIDPSGYAQLIGVTSMDVNVGDQSTICHGVGVFTDVRLNLDWITQVSAQLNDHDPVQYP